MIEISFNRSVLVNANKVYRIGMVLNKVYTVLSNPKIFLLQQSNFKIFNGHFLGWLVSHGCLYQEGQQ